MKDEEFRIKRETRDKKQETINKTYRPVGGDKKREARSERLGVV